MHATATRTIASLLSVWTTGAIVPGLLAAVCIVGVSPVVATAQSLQFDGFVEPLDDIQVAALEMGNLKEVRVQVGDRVQAGDVIAVLDDSLQASAVEIARLQTNMQGPLEAAVAERDLHAARLEKLRRLEAEGLTRPDELRRAEADLKIAEARVLTVEEERQLRAAELERYLLQLSRRSIRAPISGTVAHVFHKAGEFISPSDPSVVQLITTDQLVAVVSIPAEYATGVARGAAVRVQFATLGSALAATVQSVAPAIEGESGTVQIRILLPNAEGQLRAGDRCTVTFLRTSRAKRSTSSSRKRAMNDGMTTLHGGCAPSGPVPLPRPHEKEAAARSVKPDSAYPATHSLPPLDPLGLITALATQPTRAAAVEHLVRAVAAASGGGVVRLVSGNEQRIRRIFDSRLGTLGTESSLWHEIAAHWCRLANGSQILLHSGGDCIVRLAEPRGQGRALLWIASPADGKAVAAGFEHAAPAIAAVLWSRPAMAIPRSWRNQRRMGLLAAAAALLICIALLPVPYRVHCTAQVEAVRQRMIAAPFEATLLASSVQPGDQVAAGDLLAVLDGRPLRLELEALQADSQRAQKQHDAALAGGRISDAQLADLEARQLQRRIDLLEQRLAGLEIRSPIDGVVVSGDLRKSIGSPLELGKPLMEIAPLRRMTMEIEVPERDIYYTAVDAAVRVRLDAAATESIDGQIDILYPSAEVRDERNVFVGQWEVDNRTGALRPGMRGTAVVYGPRRPLVWPLVRRVTESVFRGIGW